MRKVDSHSQIIASGFLFRKGRTVFNNRAPQGLFHLEASMIEMVGKRFSKLLVMEFAGLGNGQQSMWRCKCDCGQETTVRGSLLRSGRAKSCGCLRGFHGMNTPTEMRKRFEKFILPLSCGCWIWLGSMTGNGYGQFMHERKLRRAHRFSYELYIGPIPNGLCTCHKCDNPACVNPGHMFLGTLKDNMQDASKKGRLSHTSRLRGEKHHQSKLTGLQVKAIRADSRAQRPIARDYGVSQNLVSQIKTRKIWAQI